MSLLRLGSILFLASFVCSGVPGAYASTSEMELEEVSEAAPLNILRGDFAVGLATNLGYANQFGSYLSTMITRPSFKASYFVLDRLALGATSNFLTPYKTAGPMVEYYFAALGNWAFVIGQEFSREISEPEYDREYAFTYGSYGRIGWSSITRLGASYFITPHFAVGADAAYTRTTYGFRDMPESSHSISTQTIFEFQLGYFF